MISAKAISALVSEIADQIQARAQEISQPRPPDPSKRESFQSLIQSIARLRGRPLLYPYLSSGLGNGPLAQLADGSVKLDFICGIGPHILGHSHPEMIKAGLRGAIEDGVMQGHLQMSLIYPKLLTKLTKIAGKNSRLAQAWICPSGSMANENALSAIRQKKKGARKILAFDRAFAGRTTMMREITSNPAIKEGLPSYNEVLRVPFCPDKPRKALEALKSHWKREKNNISAFVMELLQGDGGLFRAPREFFAPLLDFCKNESIAVWFDEIQTFGRSGEFFAFEKLDLGEYADVCSIGKAFQMSATIWTEEYNPRPGLVSGTFASSSASFHCGLALLGALEPYMGEGGKIQKIGEAWRARLKELEKESLLSQIEGWGLMWGATPLDGRPDRVSRLLQNAFQKGLICFSCGQGQKKRLRFLLPAVTQEKHLSQAFDILRASLLDIKKE